jgi:hypothetical protein
LNSTNSLQWATLSNITSTSATGTLPNGVSATITHSAGGMQTHNGMVSGSNFPNQFSVPGNGSSVIRNDLAGTITVCFSSPVTNPVIAFASIGQPGSCIQVTTSSPYSQVWSGSDVTYNSDTMFTGCEGFTIIRIPGTHSCISYFYASPEIYSTMAFGFENQTAYNPTICLGNNLTLTASGSTNYLWSPSTGLSSTSGASVVANPTVTTTYSVIDPSVACAHPTSITVTVDSNIPIITSPPSNITVCKSAIVPIQSFTADIANSTFTWTNSNTAIGLSSSGSGSVPSFTATNNTNAPITSTITVTPISSNSCIGNTYSYTITVNPIPTVNIITNQSFCAGSMTSAIEFASSFNAAGTTFSWTNSNTAIGLAASGVGSLPSFTATNNTNANISGDITVLPFENGCIGLPITFTLTVRPVPNVTLPSNQTYVNGAIVPTQTFTSTLSSAIYSWTNSNTSIGIPAEGTGNIGSFTAINITPTIQTATITVTPKNYLSYTIYKTHAGTGSLSQYGQAPQNAIEFENMFNTSNSNTTVWATGSANPLNILDWTSTTQLNNNGISTPGSNYFGIKVVGTFIPVETGVYTFQLQGDDAYDLFVNGSLVVSQYGGYSAVPHTGTISLTAGMQYTLVARQQEFAG